MDSESDSYLSEANKPSFEVTPGHEALHSQQGQDVQNEDASEDEDDPPTIQQKTLDVVAALWDEFKYLCFERVRVLDAFVTTLRDDATDTGQLTEARIEAQNLSGSLGSVSFPEGSKIASKIEQILRVEAPMGHDEVVQLSELVASLKKVVGYSPPEVEAEASRQKEVDETEQPVE